MDFSIVLACDSNYGIGINKPAQRDEENDNDGDLIDTSTIPWNIPEDMKFFRELTRSVSSNNDINTGDIKINAIIMGRTTADTLKQPLPNRLNCVITSQDTYRTGFMLFKTLDDALKDLNKRKNIYKTFVIGGAMLADAAIKHPRCRTIYLNTIANDYNCNVKLTDSFINHLATTFIRQSDDIEPNNTKVVICKKLQKQVVITFKTYSYVNHEEMNYLNLLNKIITKGDYRETRNARTYSIFGEKLVFDLDNGFPLLTTKKMFYRGIFEELLFFLRGDTDTKKLEDKKVMIWHGNTTKEYMEQYN